MKNKLLTKNEYREIQLNILTSVANICKENNLSYFLAYGTLLGAVRHKGYIPWDDDIDIFLPRSHYNKLIKSLKQQSSYKWLSVLDIDKKGYYYPFAKVIDNRTRAKMKNNITDYGIWIDIFPIDKIPRDEKKCNNFLRKCFILRAVIISMTTDFNIYELLWEKDGRAKKIAKIILNCIASIIGKENISQYYEKTITKYSKSKSEYVACLSSPYIRRERMLGKELFKSAEYEFEKRIFEGPKNYDMYLSKLYGNYMKLPPKKKRKVHNITAWQIKDIR